jgi:predicted RNA-binding protein with EMAP domain
MLITKEELRILIKEVYEENFRLSAGDYVYNGWNRSKVHKLIKEIDPVKGLWMTKLVAPPMLIGKPEKLYGVNQLEKVVDREEIEMYDTTLI